jgi:hypothetical protein
MIIANSAARCRTFPSLLRNVGLAIVCTGYLAACATVGGAAIGAGIGSIAGDPKTGMAVGAATGAVIDIFGR